MMYVAVVVVSYLILYYQKTKTVNEADRPPPLSLSSEGLVQSSLQG